MSQTQISLSETAARQIRTILDGQDARYLRVAVVGGGCSGFSYQFHLETDRAEDDLAIERDGATVLIDEMSVDFLKGSEIDYVDELIGAAFRIHNPNATAACGCGTSFSI
ncbi:MAG: iron-sulfur cluster insertion protein ErpA [Caulobacterales bacterium]|uniref:iron-sulfur cluster insertion protein ErpA n=1 Tax=Glycocaulis sp. TaxID=1969725 RepID=UPI003F9FA9D1